MASKLQPISKIVGIDFETACRKRASACAIGICVIDFATQEVIEKQCFLLNPETDFDHINMLIHGITPSMVHDAPGFAFAVDKIASFLDKKSVVVAHNASFDMSVLRLSCERLGKPVPDMDFYCTYVLARSLMKGMASYALPDVAAACGLPAFNHHHADDDAEACAKIFLHFANQLQAQTINQVSLRSGVRYGYFYQNKYKCCHKTREVQASMDAFPIEMEDTEEMEERLFDEQDIPDDSPFRGKTVVFTGALSGMPRADAEALVVSLGGIIGKGVSSKTNYVICGYQDPKVIAGHEKSSKLRKAETLAAQGKDIQIIAEDDFIAMI